MIPMSSRTISTLQRIERMHRRTNADVIRAFGNDGTTRRDFYCALELFRTRLYR